LGKVRRPAYPVTRSTYVLGKSILVEAVEAPPIFRYSTHRWREGCQPYTLAVFYPQENSWYSFMLEAESIPGSWYGWKD
jgi:hypothetical protein